MVKKKELIAALVDEDEDLGKCITCGKPAIMRSYGGEPGDYCNSCGFAMLYRINGINQDEKEEK